MGGDPDAKTALKLSDQLVPASHPASNANPTQDRGAPPSRNAPWNPPPPGCPGAPPGNQRTPARQRPRQHLLEQQAFAPVREQRQGDEHQRPCDQQVIRQLPEPAEESGQ